MKRRDFIGLLGGAATAASAAWPAWAQAKIPRIGYFWNDFPDPNVGVAGLRQGLQERGYVLGRNLLLEERYAEGDPSRTRDLITELLALGVDVLVTGDFALIQAHALTSTVPIVGVAGDFVGVGLAATLSRPGGNVTGLSLLSADLSPKWLELLQAAVPNLNRVAFLGDYSGLTAEEKRGLEQAAPRFHVTLTQLDMYRANFEASLEAITSESFDGLIVSGESDARIPHSPDCHARRAKPHASDLRDQHSGPSGRPHVLLGRFLRALAPRRGLHRPHPQRRETG